MIVVTMRYHDLPDSSRLNVQRAQIGNRQIARSRIDQKTIFGSLKEKRESVLSPQLRAERVIIHHHSELITHAFQL